MRQPIPAVQLSRRGKIAIGVIGAIVVLLILAASLVNVYTNWLWFGEVGYRGVYATVIRTRVILFAIFGVLMALIIGGNVALAHRLRPPFRPMSPEQQNLERYRIALEPRKVLAFTALVVVSGLIAGSSAQHNWKAWALWLDGGSFGIKDPQFGRDISFFAWDYPVYRLVLGFLFSAVIFSILLSAAVYYLYGALRLQTPGPKITISARRHLTVLVFFFILFKAVAYWLDRYGLVFSNRGKVTGASYTDVNASLPARTILFWIAIIIAIGVLASLWLSSPRLPAISFVVLIVLSIVVSGIYPALVQQISVKPNASQKEKKYISRNIAATRAAYGIKTDTDGGTVHYVDYSGTPNITPAQLTTPANAATIDNIRLLDPNVVSPTFTQLQRLKNVYGFPNKLDIDRYTIDGQTKDYVVGVRELRQSNLTGQQTNWINQHSVYTHGYGFVAASADDAISTSAEFTEGNIPPTGDLKITQPRVYFGELGVNYSIVGAQGSKTEYDGSDQTTTYTGAGGVPLSNIARRAAFAMKYGQINFLLNDTASAKGARIIFDRDPRQRVLKVAPFLKVDSDPYPSVINGRIVWILDGYTTMANYPYSETEKLGDLTEDSETAAGQTARQADSTFNYIRNSVKATVDAYDGTVHLYAWDESDPLLKAWMKVFPKAIQPKSAIPAGVLEHIRYPQDLFEVQRELLAKYHVTDPVQFYNVRDQWTVPSDPYAVTGDQPPYYLQAGEPTDISKTEYQLTSPMRVNSNDNLAAYISVNSQNGPDYGKMTVLRLPTGSNTFGPTQVANQFKSETAINSEVSLFDQNASQVEYGNLLSLPIGNGFLYVEPLYVRATGASQPILRRVILYFGDKVGYDETLAGALQNLNQSVVGEGINEQVSGGGPTTTPPTTSPPSTTAPTTTAPTSSPPTTTVAPSTGSPSIDAVLKRLDAASRALSRAYQTGNTAQIGAAQADLKKYSEQYLQLRARATPTPTTTR